LSPNVAFFRIPDNIAQRFLRDKDLIASIEERLKVKIEIDRESGEVKVVYDPQEAENFILLRKIFDAISVGFGKEILELLDNEDYNFEIVDLTEFVGKSKNDLIRIKGRIIGEKGKAKTNLENYTKCKILVYEDKVGILGPAEMVTIAREAVEKLARGYQHSAVYRFLDSRIRKIKEESSLWENKKYLY